MSEIKIGNICEFYPCVAIGIITELPTKKGGKYYGVTLDGHWLDSVTPVKITENKLEYFKQLILEEYEQASGNFHSAHEGYAVLKEEVDELWDEVKNKSASGNEMRNEAVQVAAMALRFLMDVKVKQ